MLFSTSTDKCCAISLYLPTKCRRYKKRGRLSDSDRGLGCACWTYRSRNATAARWSAGSASRAASAAVTSTSGSAIGSVIGQAQFWNLMVEAVSVNVPAVETTSEPKSITQTSSSAEAAPPRDL